MRATNWFAELFISCAILQNNSFIQFINHVIHGTLLYHLPFIGFFKKTAFEEEYRKFYNFGNLVITFPYLNREVVELLKDKSFSSFLETLDFIWNIHFHCHHPFEEEHLQILEFYALLQTFDTDESFFTHFPFKEYEIDSLFERLPTMIFLRNFLFKFFSKTFQGTLLISSLECFKNFLCLT